MPSQIRSADFTPDGSVVALGGNDGQLHLLTADTLTEIGQLPNGAGATWAFASFSADGSTLPAVDEPGNIVRWDTRPASWIQRACAIVARDSAEWDTYLPGVPPPAHVHCHLTDESRENANKAAPTHELICPRGGRRCIGFVLGRGGNSARHVPSSRVQAQRPPDVAALTVGEVGDVDADG